MFEYLSSTIQSSRKKATDYHQKLVDMGASKYIAEKIEAPLYENYLRNEKLVSFRYRRVN